MTKKRKNGHQKFWLMKIEIFLGKGKIRKRFDRV